MNLAKQVVVLVVLLLLCVLIGETALTVRDARREIPRQSQAMLDALSSVKAIETNTTRTEAEMAGLLNTTRHIALTEQKAEQAQLVMVTDSVSKLNHLISDADTTVLQMSQAAQGFASVPGIWNDSVRSLAEDGHTVVMSTLPVLADMDETIKDPALKQIVQNIDTTTTNVAGITDDTHQATSIVLAQIKDAYKPKNKFLSILKMAFEGTLNGAELLYYLTK